MQVAIYARVSTLNQQQEGTIASQVHLLKQHIQQQSWSLLPEEDRKLSGESPTSTKPAFTTSMSIRADPELPYSAWRE